MLAKLYENPEKNVYLLILSVGILSILYNNFLPLHGDEAYYWMWSYDLQGGYYDHAPMIAYMIYLSNFISESEWGVRLVNIFSLSIAALYIFKLTVKISDEKSALNAILIFMSVIVVHAGYIIATPDSPLLLFWTLTLYYAYMALFESKTRYFFLSGLFLGLAMMSKYSAILLVGSLLIYVLLKRRDLFTNLKLYLTILITLLAISPLLYWNYEHEWISFLFQLEHGSSKDYTINIGDPLGFLAGQFLIFSPVFTWVLFFYMYKERLAFKDDKLFFVVLSTFVTLAFFTYKGLYKPMGLNYGAPAYVGGVIFVAIMISKHELKKTLKIGLAIAITLSLIGRIAMLFFLDKIQERMYASDKIVERFSTHIKEGDSLYGDHLTIAAYIKYYLANHPDTDVAIDSRYSHYDMEREVWHKDGLVLSREANREGSLKKYYENVELIDTYELIEGVRTFRTYRVSNPKKEESR